MERQRRGGFGAAIALVVGLLGTLGGSACARNASPRNQVVARRALEILKAQHPERKFELSADGAAIRSDKLQFGMETLYRRAELEGLSGAKLDRVIEEAFAPAFEKEKEVGAHLSWTEAEPRLRVQLAPRDYLRSGPNLLHHEPLPGLVELFAIDSEKNYVFVTQDQIQKWKVTAEEVEARAVQNLEAASANLVPAATPSGDPTHTGSWLAIDINDGYAAARILLPGVRKTIAARLGEPFYFAVANRDFLVAWSRDYAYADRFAGKARRDYGEYDHPLSSEVFIADSAGVRAGKP